MSSTTSDSRASVVWIALGVVYVVWGSTYLAIRVAVETLPAFLSGAMRFAAAAVVLAIVLVARGVGALRISRRQAASAALIGVLLLTGGNGLVSVAEQHISSGLAALLVASVPLWLVVFRWAARDRPPLRTVAGVLVGFGGLAVLTSTSTGGHSSGTFGVIVVLIASFCWALGSFLPARLPMPESPFVASVYEMAAGALALLVIGLARGEHLHHVSGRSWLALGYLITFGSLLAFTCYAWLLGNAPISLVGTYAYVNPAVAVLLGAVFLSEALHWPMVVGGAVIIAGVGLVVSTERQCQPRGRPPGTPGKTEPEPTYRR